MDQLLKSCTLGIEYVTVDEAGQSNDGLLPSIDDERVQPLFRWLVHGTTGTDRD